MVPLKLKIRLATVKKVPRFNDYTAVCQKSVKDKAKISSIDVFILLSRMQPAAGGVLLPVIQLAADNSIITSDNCLSTVWRRRSSIDLHAPLCAAAEAEPDRTVCPRQTA